MAEYFIVDVRPNWRGDPYISLWRPNNAGYAYPLPWAGRYSQEEVDGEPSYYASAYAGRYERFPVPCEAVERLAVRPKRGIIDGDTGPVLRNDETIREALRKARYLPPTAQRARPQSGKEGR